MFFPPRKGTISLDVQVVLCTLEAYLTQDGFCFKDCNKSFSTRQHLVTSTTVTVPGKLRMRVATRLSDAEMQPNWKVQGFRP